MNALWEFELSPIESWELTDLVAAYRNELPSGAASWLESYGGITGLEDRLLDACHLLREVSALTIGIGRWDSFDPVTYKGAV